ncbi:PAS domain S-box-containing protein [Malaciobacter marinus]|jgi:PAS domain S-box-containing protein|uniref:histidine kinase n=1 Tax=Malaciobacter marinus TaxID=505249 RepID=A0AB36ZTT8_9BACT|nr:PAS domain S-box protein [Malaciobacter marinus]PPK58981.1 PAS domain S-box-containing protein [Malaciobacter marinus]
MQEQIDSNILEYLNITKGLYLILDKNSNIIFANEQACKILGVSQEKIVSMNWVDSFIPQELKSYISNVIKEIANKNMQINRYVENEIVTLDGQRKFISWKNSFVEKKGEVTQVICSGEDITEKREIQKYIEEKEERLKAIFDFSPLGILISDKTGKMIEANLAFLNMLGYSQDEILGKSYLDITHSDYLDLNEDHFNRLIDNEIGMYKITKRYITKNNELLWGNVTVSTIKNEFNEILYVLAIIEDITQMKTREEDIIAQRKFLHTIIDENPNIIIVKDYEGKFVLVNQAIARLYNTTTEDMIGKSDGDYNLNEDQVKHYLQSVKEIMDLDETKVVYEESTDILTGKIRYFQSIKKPISDRYGNKQLLIIANDITDIKEAQKKLKDNEEMIHHQSKMAAMGEMLENIAHQWRQPLSVITTSASSVKIHKEMGTLSDDFLDEVLDAIVKSGNHLSQTIDDFRDFFKPDKEKVRFNIKNTYKKALFLVSSKLKNREIDIIENIEDIDLYGFDNELVQVIMNLINNARDALEESSLEYKYIFIDIYKDKENNVILKICDNAGGIPVNVIGKIFEPYFTTKHKSLGTGIGLYMCEEILVKHMNGEISVKNKEFEYEKNSFKGAEFTLKIPILEPLEN